MNIFSNPSSFEVKETSGAVTIKPGLYGKTNVLLDGQVQMSYPTVRQARVYAAHLESAQKNIKNK